MQRISQADFDKKVAALPWRYQRKFIMVVAGYAALGETHECLLESTAWGPRVGVRSLAGGHQYMVEL